MTIRGFLHLGVMLVLLAGCAAPTLLIPGSSQLVWALLKPLVGYDPNAVNLWEQPLIRNRMTAFLGTRYEPVMRFVRTANELQQEGPLFYVVSRHAPVPAFADKVGLVWNRDMNQFAALLHKDGVSQILTEKLQTSVEDRTTAEMQKVLPKWPAELAPLAALSPLGPAPIQAPLEKLTAPSAPVPPSPRVHRAPISGPSGPVPDESAGAGP